jgi:hypothetical protein
MSLVIFRASQGRCILRCQPHFQGLEGTLFNPMAKLSMPCPCELGSIAKSSLHFPKLPLFQSLNDLLIANPNQAALSRFGMEFLGSLTLDFPESPTMSPTACMYGLLECGYAPVRVPPRPWLMPVVNQWTLTLLMYSIWCWGPQEWILKVGPQSRKNIKKSAQSMHSQE